MVTFYFNALIFVFKMILIKVNAQIKVHIQLKKQLKKEIIKKCQTPLPKYSPIKKLYWFTLFIAKLSPAQIKLQLSLAEFALFPHSPTNHPPTRKSLFLKLQQVLTVRNFLCSPSSPQHQLAGLSLLYFHFLQPTTHPPQEILFLKLQQVLMVRNFYAAQSQ